MFRLKLATSPEWTRTVLADLGAFLIDHAYCERKASSSALKMVSLYPDKKDLVSAMIDLAREELEHFAIVYRQIEARGLILTHDAPDLYVNQLTKAARQTQKDIFLDRLLISALIEGRSCERFILLTEALPAGELRDLYLDLTRSEARHHGLFLRLAEQYCPAADIEPRLSALLDAEADIVRQLPLRPVVH